MKWGVGTAIENNGFGSTWYVVIDFRSEGRVDGDNVAEYVLAKFTYKHGDFGPRIKLVNEETTAGAQSLEEWASDHKRQVIEDEEDLPDPIREYVESL